MFEDTETKLEKLAHRVSRVFSEHKTEMLVATAIGFILGAVIS